MKVWDWENSKKLWKHLAPAARVPTAFLALPNLHSYFCNSIETRYWKQTRWKGTSVKDSKLVTVRVNKTRESRDALCPWSQRDGPVTFTWRDGSTYWFRLWSSKNSYRWLKNGIYFPTCVRMSIFVHGVFILNAKSMILQLINCFLMGGVTGGADLHNIFSHPVFPPNSRTQIGSPDSRPGIEFTAVENMIDMR